MENEVVYKLKFDADVVAELGLSEHAGDGRAELRIRRGSDTTHIAFIDPFVAEKLAGMIEGLSHEIYFGDDAFSYRASYFEIIKEVNI